MHIRFNAATDLASDFYRQCLDNRPHLSVITDAYIEEIEEEFFVDFQITNSKSGSLDLTISPDFALCDDCRAEMHNAANKRHQYPFITCTVCGPRYSILTGLPYDRPLTTMDSFHMCDPCSKEYHDPTHRRHYAQTNSCKDCGIKLSLKGSDGQNYDHLDQSEMIIQVVKQLGENKIVAVKGIGGYLLLCNAYSKTAIDQLRSRKNRPAKPFAVLFKDIKAIVRDCKLSEEEKAALLSPASPIVILSANPKTCLHLDSIAPGLKKVGAMIPYAPVLELISTHFGNPLIATSANISGFPILYNDGESQLFKLADYVLSNNRAISFSQDDSVVRFSESNQHQVLLRRSRGFAPATFKAFSRFEKCTLALGAEMKGVFAISADHNIYGSQYLGNLAYYENQLLYEKTLIDFSSLIKANPGVIIVDKHPSYFTSQLGRRIADETGISLCKVQHHEAHFTSVLGENQLLDEERVLGVIWDGTGYGDDGNIWGGEFFNYSDGEMHRIGHISYFSHLAGDKMARDTRLCALALAGVHNVGSLKKYFKDMEWDYYTKLIAKPPLKTSSMGRVFDAVAFLAGISKTNTYEGQSAMLLEQEARSLLKGNHQIKPYSISINGQGISLQNTFDEIFEDIKKGNNTISARFHLSLVEIIKTIAVDSGYQKIAFSGGVFQNGLLVDLIIDQLGQDYQLFFHKELSPNDENIAFGQLVHSKYLKNHKMFNSKETEQCV